jgi:hypothetical protein
MSSQSHSSTNVSFVDRYRNLLDLYQMYRKGGAAADMACAMISRKSIPVRKGRPFSDLNAVEIGFGAKPYRIIYFNARGVNAVGIDMDQPVWTGSPSNS